MLPESTVLFFSCSFGGYCISFRPELSWMIFRADVFVVMVKHRQMFCHSQQNLMVTETNEMWCICEQLIRDKYGRWIWRSVFIADNIWKGKEQTSWTVETYSRIKSYGQRHKMAAITTVRTSTQDDSQRYDLVFWVFQAHIVSAWGYWPFWC
jgi:hypothetical protein